MKKTWVTIVNKFIMIAMLTFVVLYSNTENRVTTLRQIEHFENTTISMEHVTENYLEGEQRICDVWARYINSENMTIEDAASFIRISHVLPNASAHIVYTDTLSGLSTRTRQDGSGDDAVSYARIGLLNDVSWISDIGESINISRSYTNPINGEQFTIRKPAVRAAPYCCVCCQSQSLSRNGSSRRRSLKASSFP